MIDLTPYAALALAAAFGVPGVALLIVSARRRKREADSPELTGADFARMRPANEVLPPEALDAFKRAKPQPPRAHLVKRDGMGGVWGERPAPDVGTHLRFFVSTKPARDGYWRVRDRANFCETPQLYTRRSSALRAARRLNATRVGK